MLEIKGGGDVQPSLEEECKSQGNTSNWKDELFLM